MKPLKIHELKSVYDMMSLKGKTAFITGGGGGIGRSCAAGLAEVGANIVLMDIPQKQDVLQENCQAITDRYGVEAISAIGDVSNEEDVIRMFDETVKKFGTVDVVFSNAGIAVAGDCPSTISLEKWNKAIDVNLTGMMLVDRTGANIMRDHGHSGSIINTASMSGLIINKKSRDSMDTHMVSYAATKAAAIHLTKSIAINYVDYNIRCNSISPGLILSGLHDNMDWSVLQQLCDECVPMNRFASLNEIIGLVVYLATDLSTYVTGSNFVIDGGFTIW